MDWGSTIHSLLALLYECTSYMPTATSSQWRDKILPTILLAQFQCYLKHFLKNKGILCKVIEYLCLMSRYVLIGMSNVNCTSYSIPTSKFVKPGHIYKDEYNIYEHIICIQIQNYSNMKSSP